MPWRLIDPATNPVARRVAHVIAGLATGLLLVGAVVAVVTGVYLIDAVRDTQVSNTKRAETDRARDEQTAATAEAAARAAQRIEDCTTPGRECFQASQERLGRTVGTINRYAIAAAYCADRPGTQTVRELERCIAAITEQRQPREDRQ
jgi:hypothetical protein